MTPVKPPSWSPAELDRGRLEAIRLFREDRMQEPLEDYVDAFDFYREQAQSRGLALFWAHDLLGPFVGFLDATR